MRSCSAVLCSVAILATGAASAYANGTGGVSVPAPSTHAASGSTSGATASAPTAHAAPVTAKTANVTYKGPVYEKAVTGEVIPYIPPAPTGQASSSTGGAAVAATATEGKPDLLVPGSLARYVDGLAAAPMSAPAAVQEIIWAGNQLIGLPYIYGGGHNATFTSPGYDCSGTVSFALHGADLLVAPEDSSEFMGWGAGGVGTWVTIFSNPGHAYMTVAGMRLDTSAADDPSNEQGPRWRPLRQSNAGYKVRPPVGL
jgi:cell wall-associated NlpC family hydrolase